MSLQISCSIVSTGFIANAQGGSQPTNFPRTTPDPFPRDQVIFDGDLANGGSSAMVRLSGTTTAEDGQAIEARAVSQQDGGAQSTGWVQIGVASGGTWSGEIEVPVSPVWFRAETRVAGSSAQHGVMSETFGVGLVAMLSEQSSMARAVVGAYNQTPYESIGNAPGDFQIAYISNRGTTSGSDANSIIVGPRLVTDADPFTASMAAMAATFAKTAPGLKVLILMDAKSGVAQTATLRASNDVRLFSSVENLVDVAHSYGSKVGVFVASHFASVAAEETGDWLRASFKGLDETGTLIVGFDQTAQFPDVSYAGQTFNHIWAQALPEVLDDRMQVLTANIGRPLPQVIDSTSNKFEDRRVVMDALYQADSANFQRLADLGLFKKGEPGESDTLHPDSTVDDGYPRRMRAFAATVLRGTGHLGFTTPTFDQITWTPDYLELGWSGGTLTTEAKQLGQANFPTDPSGAPSTPGAAEVMGFQWGDFSPVTRVEIVDAGGNPAAAGRIRIYPEQGQTLNGLSKVYYYVGGSGVEGAGSAHEDAGLHRHFPIADVGVPNLPGWMVAPFVDPEAINAANTLSTGDPTFAVTSGAPLIETASAIGTDATGLTVEARFVRSGSDNFGLAEFHTNDSFGFIRVTPAGRVRIRFRNGSNQTWFDYTGDADVVDGLTQLTDVRVAVDLVTERVHVFVDGAELADPNLGAGTSFSATPGFRGGSALRVADTDLGTVASVDLWREFTAGGARPASVPWLSVVADAGGQPVVTHGP